MTIVSKLSDVGGLEFVVSDATDSDDVGGFSDAIQVVSAKTAKFSGGATMQANSGLKIGLSQVKINTAAEIPIQPRDVFIESLSGNWTGFVGQETAGSSSTSPGPTNSVVFDFESIDTQTLQSTTNGQFGGAGNGITLLYEISDDDISYTSLGSVTNQDGDFPTVTNYGTRTWRYVRVTHTSTFGVGGNTASTGLLEIVTQPPVNNVTVKVRSSVTLDTADGTVLISDQLMNELSTLTFDTQLLLTGSSQFVTVEIVSQTGNEIPVTLSDITSVKEV